MFQRTLNMLTALSAILLAMVVVAFVAGYSFTAWDYSILIGDATNVGLWSRGLDSRLALFNDKEYGPYCGSIIGIVGPDGKTYPPLRHEEYFGDSWGVYYRYFQWYDGYELWTLMISLWYPLVLFGIMPIGWAIYNFSRRRRRLTKRYTGAGIAGWKWLVVRQPGDRSC